MASKFCPQTILLIPDVHAKEGDKLERLDAMAGWLKERKLPLTKIVQIGDLWCLPSLCLHDKDRPEWFERKLDEDLEAGFRALDKIVTIAEDHDLLQSDITITLGNHEDRYDKFMASDNRLRSSPFPKTLKTLIRRRHKYLPVFDFLTPYTFAGITFQHYFTSGVMGRAQGGENLAPNLLRNQLTTVVCGHAHVYSYAERTAATGHKVQALCAGCLTDASSPPTYARGTAHLWRNGFSILHVTAPGNFDLEFVSLERIMR
jgi:hypothetical protein